MLWLINVYPHYTEGETFFGTKRSWKEKKCYFMSLPTVIIRLAGKGVRLNIAWACSFPEYKNWQSEHLLSPYSCDQHIHIVLLCVSLFQFMLIFIITGLVILGYCSLVCVAPKRSSHFTCFSYVFSAMFWTLNSEQFCLSFVFFLHS